MGATRMPYERESLRLRLISEKNITWICVCISAILAGAGSVNVNV
jgi:hypothetical protein